MTLIMITAAAPRAWQTAGRKGPGQDALCGRAAAEQPRERPPHERRDRTHLASLPCLAHSRQRPCHA